MELGYALKLQELRKDRKLRQKDIADLLQTTQQQIYKYENEIQELPIRHLKTLCIFYGVSADSLLDLPKGLKNYPR